MPQALRRQGMFNVIPHDRLGLIVHGSIIRDTRLRSMDQAHPPPRRVELAPIIYTTQCGCDSPIRDLPGEQ